MLKCYNSQENFSCIDLILTNKQKSFQDTGVIETRLFDYHKMTGTVLKPFKKQPPRLYRTEKKYYSQITFRVELKQLLPAQQVI